MRVVSWNCNGAYRKKFQYIKDIDADIHVIQECENPITSGVPEYIEYAANHIWHGSLKDINKGVGIFAKPEIKLNELHWDNPDESLFIPVEVNGFFVLLAVWTTIELYYIGEYVDFQNANSEKFNNNMVIIGDFNSGVNFDTKKGILENRSHTTVVNPISYWFMFGISCHYRRKTRSRISPDILLAP